MTPNSKRIAAFLASSLLLLPALATSAHAQGTDTGEVYLVQGLVGKTVDFVVDGKVVADGRPGKDITGALELSGGDHEVEVREGEKSLAKATVTVDPGSSTDVIVHLPVDADQAPVISAFDNDLSPVGDGQARLAVAHTAAVGPADILVEGDVLFSNVASAETLTQAVPAGDYEVKIVPTAQDGPVVFGPATLSVKPGTLTRVFAIGDVADASMEAVIQEIPIGTRGGGTPAAVHAGTGGQAAALMPQQSSPVALALVGGGLVALTLGLLLARRRTTSLG